MHVIDSYTFGRMTVNGQSYESDLIIYPDRIESAWWRSKGHIFSVEDLEKMLAAGPEVIIIGSGSPGMLSVPKKAREVAASRGVELHVKPTEAAAQLYNEIAPTRKVVAGFHLTC